MKKNVKNIMLGTISVVGVSTILAVGLSTVEINKKQIIDKEMLLNSSKLISNEVTLTSDIVKELGWDSKKTITLEDWKTMAPNITKIGSGAFDSAKIESITIPSSIISIESLGFAYTGNLLSLNFEQNSQLKSIGFQAFESSNLKSIIIPENVESIGNFAFASSKLSSIAISNPFIRIGDSAFLQTNSLQNITIHDKHKSNLDTYGFSVKQIDSINFTTSSSNEKTIEKFTGTSLSSADVVALGWNTKTSILLSDWSSQAPNVEIILTDAFQNNATLVNLDIPSTMRFIQNQAFFRTIALRSIIFPENHFGKIELGDQLFLESSLEQILLPSPNLEISNIAFENAVNLSVIQMPNSLKEGSATHRWGFTEAQYNNIIWRGAPIFTGTILEVADVQALGWNTKEIITLDDWAIMAPNVTHIGDNAFANAQLKNIDIPLGIQEIKRLAFSYNLNLETVDFPINSELTTIGVDAFKGNPKLERITIPNSVISLQTGVFADSGLKFITFQDRSKLETISDYVFANSKIESIIVPQSVTSIVGASVFANTSGTLTRIKMPHRLIFTGGGSHRWGLTTTQWALIEFTYEPFAGTTLNNQNVRNLGWDKKTTITLDDWAMAPNVVNIGRNAFLSNQTLVSIEVPREINIIGESAFRKTINLKNVNFEANSTLLEIGKWAFQGSGLENINLPVSVLRIQQGAFSQMTLLRSFTFPPNVTTFSSNLLNSSINLENLVLPLELKVMEGHLFVGLTKLIKIVIPLTVETISSDSFTSSHFTDITMPSSFKGDSVAKYGFTQTQWDSIKWVYSPFLGTELNEAAAASIGWNTKTTITLEDWATYAPNVETIEGAFNRNDDIVSIAIPNTIKVIGLYAFSATSQLRNVIFQEGSTLSEIGTNAFYNSRIIAITLPDSVTILSEGAFRNVTSLISFVIPPRVTVIPHHLLRGTRVTEVIIPSGVVSIGFAAFAENPALTKIIVPDSVTSIKLDSFTNTLALIDITMPAKFKTTEPNYGFTRAQWDVIKWTGNITLVDDLITSFEAAFIPNRDIIDQNPPEVRFSSGASVPAKAANFNLKFALGTSVNNLIIDWSDSTIFDNAIHTYTNTKDILLSEINIFAKMYLPSGTGPEEDTIGLVKYNWNKEPVKIYDSATGTIANFWYNPNDNQMLGSGEITKATSKVLDGWSNDLKIEGNNISEVSITSSTFDIAYYKARGIDLQVAQKITGEPLTWENIDAFGVKKYDAVINKTFAFRLNISDANSPYHVMYGSDVLPTGLQTAEVEKNATGKMELPVNLTNLSDPAHVNIFGRILNPRLLESDELFTFPTIPEPVSVMKQMIKITYSFNNSSSWVDTEELNDILGMLRGDALNNLVLNESIRARYEFTELGKASYFSSSVFGDPSYVATNNFISMVNVEKDYDLTSFVEAIPRVMADGDTTNITWTNTLDLTALEALGVNLEWSYWTRNVDNDIVRSEWTTTPPSQVSVLENPLDLSVFPISIRLVNSSTPNDNTGLYEFSTGVESFVDIIKGYEPNISTLGEIFAFTETLGVNYIATGLSGNVVSMSIDEKFVDVSAEAQSKLKLQFSLGKSKTELIIPWGDKTAFRAAIQEYSLTQDILKTELNIYMKLILVGGTGPNEDHIDGITYIWDRREVEIYNNETGLNGTFADGIAGSKIRTYSKIISGWSDSLSVEGKKSSEVKILNRDNQLNLEYYKARGIILEASVDGELWTNITVFNSQVFNAAATNTMSFRLIVEDNNLFEMYGEDVAVTTPTGTTTNIIVKDVIAKIELTGILANNLTTDKLQVSGTTNNLIIMENDELYTASGMSLAEAKTMFEIKYSFDGTTYLAKDAFVSALNGLTTTTLNSLNLSNFKVRYEFTEAGLAKYYSTQVFNDPDAIANVTIKSLTTTGVIKTLDLNEYITQVANVQLSGTTLHIVYANELDLSALNALGVKIQWSYWTRNATNEIVRSEWVEEKPTAVSILKNPTNPDNLYPVAIRFVKLDEANNSIELKNIVDNVASDVDMTKGYATDVTGLNEIFTFSEVLGTNYQVSGIVGNVVSMTIKEEQINVSEMAKEKLEMQFAIGQNAETLTIPWSNAVDFKSAIATFNETQDILKTELNIYMKLVLIGGTGPDSNIINEIKYVWDNRVVEVYNNVIGINLEFDTIDVAGSKLRAYAKIADNWAESLSAEGNKSSNVTISSLGNVFDIRYYTSRGIKLEASVNEVDWILIEEFNATSFDASATNKMSFRLSVVDPSVYEIYGSTVAVTTPTGTTTNIVTKDIIAKIELTGILANNLTTDKLQVSGTTNNLIIVENDELYTASGMSLAEAKTMFEIKYSFDGIIYFAKDEFVSALNGLRTSALNSLALIDFSVRYEFTAAGLAKYYSLEVFNDPDSTSAITIKSLTTTGIIKTLDLNEYITKVADVRLSGTTLDIAYANELDLNTLNALGVKIQWSYWTKDATNNIVRSEWVEEKPTSVSILKNPTNPDDLYPVAIRFVKLDEANNSIELKNIVDNITTDTDIVKGYAPNITGLNEIVALSELLGTNYQVSGVVGNVVSMTIKEEQINVSELAKEKMEMQFAIGSVSNNLTIDWANAANFKVAIETFNQSNDILKTQLNIYMKLVLIGGTGVNSDIIGDTRYTWDNRVVEVYNNETGVNAEFDTIDVAGSKLRAYAKIADNWAESLSAEGNKSNAVFIQSKDNIFDINYFKARGIKLEVSVDGTTNWLTIDAFGDLPIDASATNKMSFRLIIEEPEFYEMYGNVIEVTDPVGTQTQIITKDIIAKIELVGVIASDLITDKLQVSGTTHDFIINESDELYTISGMSVLEAKKWFEIKYSFDGTTYLAKNEFTQTLNEMRGLTLNNLELANFKVRYEFTEAGLAKYYSLEVFNDPEASPTNTIKNLNTTNIIKSIDVTQEIASIANIELTGTTENLNWANMGLINNISKFVNVEYGTYSKTDTGVAYSWSIERPTSIYTKTTPEGHTNFPVAIRFVPKLPTDQIEIGSIDEPTSSFVPTNTELGYKVDTSKITTIINIDTTELVNKLLLTGFANDLNGGAAIDIVEKQAMELVDPIYRKDVKLNYEISIRPGVWYSFDELKAFMLSYYNDFENVNSGIMIFDNGVIPGVQITAKFVSKIPNAFIINATPDAQTLLKTDKIKTKIDLREYVKVLQTVKVIPSGTTSADVGTLLIPGMTPGNILFGGKTYAQIESILSSSIQMEFKAPGFHGDAWVTLDKITAVNFNNELFIRFVVKADAETNIQLSLVGENDYKDHLTNGFQLILALPKEIQVDSNDLIGFISITGNTKNIVINDSRVYEDLITKDPIYEGKVQILYTIGTVPLHLDPTQPDKFEFTKEEIISLLATNILDITLAQKQITARYALANGISEDDFIIKDENAVNLNIDNVLLYINKSNYYSLASKLKVSGTSSEIVWGQEILDLKNALSEGLIIQYSIDPSSLALDAINSPKWTETQPTTISPTDKFLAIRLVTKTGYIFEEKIKMFIVDTSNVLLIIELQKAWMQNIVITGNTKNININSTKLENLLATNEVPGKEFIVIQYYFGDKAPLGLGIPSEIEWFTAAQIKTIFENLQGAKNEQELILFRDSLKSRFSLTNEGFKDYRLNIDGVNSDEQAPSKPEFYESLITSSLNIGFKGYINLNLINTFNPDSFKVVGSDVTPILEVGNKIGEMLDYYKDPTTSPFDIYYTNVQGDFSNQDYKLFGNNGFISEFHPNFKIKLDVNGDALPIWFKLEARNGYQVWENNRLLAGGKIIKINNIVVEKQIKNPLTEAPDIRFNANDGSNFYQGEGSFSVYVKGTTTVVDSAFLNATHPDIVPAVLKLEYNISKFEYTPEELEAVKLDKSKWVDEKPTDLSVGQFVMTRVAINNDKFTMIGADTITPQIRVKGLMVHADSLSVNPDLKLTNIDYFGYDAIDGQTRIEEAKLNTDPLGNYLGADLMMSVETEFYKNTSGVILIDTNGIPIVKRNSIGSTQNGTYKDGSGKEILDHEGNTIPIWTIQEGGRTIPAEPLRTGIWQTPIKMQDGSFLGLFSQEETSSQWKLFDSQFVKLSFVPRIGQGTPTDPDFIFDTSVAVPQEIQLKNIKYPVQTNGVKYEFIQSQVESVKYASDDGEELPYTGNAHISSELTILRKDGRGETTLKGQDISDKIKVDFDGQVEINMFLNRKNGSPQSASGVNISQFKDLQNGDIITISFKSSDDIFLLPQPIEPLIIVVKDLYVKPLSDDLFKYLRPNFVGILNGSGSFDVKVTNPNNPTDTNEAVLGINQWYEYQVWNPDKTLKTEWTKDETKINNLVNGDKVEWKIINKDGVFDEDYYNTLLDSSNMIDGKVKFRVVDVVDNIEETVQEGIGSSNEINPNIDGVPQYPTNSGWVVSGLKVEIALEEEQKELFEIELGRFIPIFNGVDKFGTLTLEHNLNDGISKDVEIVVYTTSQGGIPRKITDFSEAGLSNGDIVWATIAPSKEAEENNLIIDESVSSMESTKFEVKDLTILVQSSTQTLMIALISASSVVFIGLVGLIIFVKRNKKLNNNKLFKK